MRYGLLLSQSAFESHRCFNACQDSEPLVRESMTRSDLNATVDVLFEHASSLILF